MRKWRAVHQFTPGISVGDGVSNGVLFTRTLLRELGYVSEIFAADIDPALAVEVRPLAAYGDGADGADSVLLVHHCIGHSHADWIAAQQAVKVLVYHNITPSHFFAPEHPLHAMTRHGRQMLVDWLEQGLFAASIGDSAYNSAELLALGYGNVHDIALLVDVEACLAKPWEEAVVAAHADRDTLLFVGRLTPHKCQHDLVAMMAELLPRRRPGQDGRPVRPLELLLVGGTVDAEYEMQLRGQIRALGLEGQVHLLGKVDEARLYGLYRAADLFVCLSEHEGFGMPLIEAMLCGLPVVAADHGSVADTMGCGGLVVKDKSPARLAALLACLLDDQGGAWRAAMRAGQAEQVQRFGRERLKAALQVCLRTLE